MRMSDCIRYLSKFICLVMLGLVCVCAWAVAPLPAVKWPAIQWPSGVRHFPIAHTLSVQGVPMHVQGFTSNYSPLEVMVRLQKQYANQLVSTQQSTDTYLLGKQEGQDYFLNFRIKPAAGSSGSQGEASITPMLPNLAYINQFKNDMQWWSRELPGNYRLLQHQVSIDAKHQAVYLVIEAPTTVRGVRQALTHALAQQGLQPEESRSASVAEASPLHFTATIQLKPKYQSLNGVAQSGVMTIHASGPNTHSAVVNLVFMKEGSP